MKTTIIAEIGLNHNGNMDYVNATNHNDGSAFGDSNSNVTCVKTSLGYYS